MLALYLSIKYTSEENYFDMFFFSIHIQNLKEKKMSKILLEKKGQGWFQASEEV